MHYLLDLRNINLKNKGKIGYYLFYLGIFFIPTTLFIGSIFLIISFILSSYISPKNYFKDRWNIPFFLGGVLILISAFFHNFFLNNPAVNLWNSNLSYLGLFNWIPLFWIFWASQKYLVSNDDRKRFSLVLLAGSLPILIAGFAQNYFEIYGPFRTLYGLIVWYQRKIIDPAGISSIFNNANYAGSWLSIILPFSIAFFLDITKLNIKKVVSIIFLSSISWSILLTNSRSAWGSFLASLPIVIGLNSLRWLIPLLVLLSIILSFTTMPLFTGNLQDILQEIIPNKIWMEFSYLGFQSMDVSRFGIWDSALTNITFSPLFGYGGGSFSAIYESQSGFWKGHAHNLPLELAFSYGVPSALIIFVPIVVLLVKSFKKIFLEQLANDQKLDFISKAWWASIFILFISQQIDVHYFDGRISIIFWILLAGTKNIITSKNKI